MTKRKLLELVVLCLGHALSGILTGAVGWDFQTVAVSLLSILAIYYGHKRIGLKSIFMLIPVAPFFILYTVMSLQVANPLNYPVWICGLAVSLLTVLLIGFRVKVQLATGILILLLLLEYFFIYPNAFSYLTMERDPQKYKLGQSILVDNKGDEVTAEQLKGKVILFDIWHSACLPCINQFPEIQELYDQYKNDPQVRIVSLNFPLEREKGVRQTKLTQQYSFEKIYFKDIAEYEKLSIQAVPFILIVDQD